MNLYLRLLRVIFQTLFSRRIGLLDTSCVVFRVWPNDCDLNMHLNNGRFLTFMDLGRVHLLGQMGLLKALIKRRWSPVIAAVEMSFIRPIKPLQRFRLETRLLTWDEKYFYIEQRFTVGGRLCAIGLVKGLFLRGGERFSSEQVLSLIGEPVPPPAMPEILRHWSDLADLKRRHVER